MSQFFRKLSAAIGIAPRADKGNNRDVTKLPLTATLSASEEALDLASEDGDHANDDLALLKQQLEEAKAELLSALAKHVDEVACSNGNVKPASDRQPPPPQDEAKTQFEQATVIESLQQQMLLKDQALTEKCKELSSIIDCSEKILTYATAVIERYESDNKQLRSDLRKNKESLASARGIIAERDDAIQSQNTSLEHEQRSTSLIRSENQALQNRLQSTERTLEAKAAEVARLEQKLKDDAADQQDRVRRLHEILVGKEDALKNEHQTSLRRQTEVDSLSKRLVETEKALQAKHADVARLEHKVQNDEVEHQKSIWLLQQTITEKDRQHAEEIDSQADEIRAAERASERSKRALERERSILAEDYRLLRSLIGGNPRLVTVANIEDVLKLTQRHPTDSEDVKRVCEERLDHFHNLLPASKKYELAMLYGLGYDYVKSLITANPSVITAENFERVVKLVRHNCGDINTIRVCEDRLRQFGDSMPLTRKYRLVLDNALNMDIIRNIVRENPRLITEENIEDILGLVDRHPTTNDAIKRVCEQRIRHFGQSLTLIRKCELFLRHDLDMQLLGRIIRDNSKPLTANDVEDILKVAQRYPCDSNDVKRECENCLRHLWHLNITQKYELARKYSLRVLEQELKAKIEAQKAAAKPFRFGLPKSFFAVEHDYDFRRTTDNGQVYRSGGLVYVRPLGCERFALKVSGKYLPDDGWLTGRGGREWAVAYHGTTLENVAGIVRNGFDLLKGIRFAFGSGIYSSPYPKVALGYSTPYTYNGKQYKIIMQVRVDPTKLTRHDNGNIYLLPDGSSIRPYAVCVFAA